MSSIAPKVELSYKHHIYYNTTNQREEIYGKDEENEELGCLDLGELVSLQKWDEWVFIALKWPSKVNCSSAGTAVQAIG